MVSSFYLLLIFAFVSMHKSYGEIFDIEKIENALENSCVFLYPIYNFPAMSYLEKIFYLDIPLYPYTITNLQELSSNKGKFNWHDLLYQDSESESIFLFAKIQRDRSCLLSPSIFQHSLLSVKILSYLSLDRIAVDEVNSICGTHRDNNGNLNRLGRSIENIMKSLYHIPKHIDEARCDVKYLSMNHFDNYEFLHKYLKSSKPVIFRSPKDSRSLLNLIEVGKIWSNEYFKLNYGNKTVHVKIAPKGIFEGIENTRNWTSSDTGRIPDEVLKHLKYKDLVVVRPATLEMTINEFIDILESPIFDASGNKISFYLEYTSIKELVPHLLRDAMFVEKKFIGRLVNREHANVWFGDGETVGKLHFDAYDNILAMLSGSKTFRVFEPYNNSRMYEGHIREAKLTYDAVQRHFNRNTLMNSTSMVMSPIDLNNVDNVRFPEFRSVKELTCHVEEGDVLFLPAFWWHEVESQPSEPDDHSAPRNLAVNFWYEPFLTKEFPCEKCPLKVNPTYYHLL